ncbi:MAG: transcriptional regulator [Desulfuromonas sp.]|nr:MAG: transcriptional regulator [Desulfuromonas sp.]
MKNAEKYPEILRDLHDGLVEILTEAGASDDDADRLAFAAAEKIRKRWAGLAVYIPKGKEWELTDRDREIWRRFVGHNKRALCREYGISEQRLYQVVARVREEEFKRKQMRLF